MTRKLKKFVHAHHEKVRTWTVLYVAILQTLTMLVLVGVV